MKVDYRFDGKKLDEMMVGADGGKPEEKSVVTNRVNGVDIIFDYLTDITLQVTATKSIFDCMFLYGSKQKLKQKKQDFLEKKEQEITQQAKTTEQKAENEQTKTREEIIKEPITFVERINSSKNADQQHNFGL